MPTRTTDTQTYQGQSVQCAKFVSSEEFTWKAARVVQAETDYQFQVAIKASSAATITIQVGNSVKTQAVTTDWTRYVIDFPAVTNDVDSLYITFPAGTYWTYNVQLEQAQTPASWRPAPEDAEDYADQAAKQAVDAQTQLDIFNKLTNNGVVQGIYLLDGQLYINGEYIAANTISGNKINGGVISGTEINIGDGVFVVDENGQVTASNFNMTGGSMMVDSAGGLASNVIMLRNTWAGEQSVTSIAANRLMSQRGADDAYEAVQITDDVVQGIKKASGETIKNAFMLQNINGAGGLILYNNGVQSGAYGSTITLYDTSGVRRVLLNTNGLYFYNASGTLTKTYSAT